MTDCTAVGDEVVIMIMMMLSMVMMCISLSFYDWLTVVLCTGVGLGWVSYLVGLVGSMIWTHGQLCVELKVQCVLFTLYICHISQVE